MKNTTWTTVKGGQILTFRYQSEGDVRGFKRTIICLDPKYEYRKKSTGRVVNLVVGLEVKHQLKGSISPSKLKKLFEILGATSKDIQNKNLNETQVLQETYFGLKSFLKAEPIFKTYLLRKCRKYRVFLENNLDGLNELQVKQVVKKVIKEGSVEVGSEN